MPLFKEEVSFDPVLCPFNWPFCSVLTKSDVFYRKLRVKRSIKVPAISNKVADIPPDEYSWRKYGQKPIKGSPHPRYI